MQSSAVYLPGQENNQKHSGQRGELQTFHNRQMYQAPSMSFQIMSSVRSRFISENNMSIVELEGNSGTAVTLFLRMLAKPRIWSLYNRLWKGDLAMQEKNNEKNMKNREVCSGSLQHFGECGGKFDKQNFQIHSLKLNI